jgi:hypothetical protein
MLGALKKRFLASVKGAFMKGTCPRCGHQFNPFANREITSWSDFTQPCTCPKCGSSFTVKELTRTHEHDNANPEGPFQRPPESRIERRSEAGDRLTFHIPSAGRWGIWLFLAILVNIIIWPVFLGTIENMKVKGFDLTSFLFVSFFAICGIRLAYEALRHRFGSTTLELGPETIRLQRSLFRTTRNHHVPAAGVRTVSKVLFYTQNYQPVYGIEIDAGRRIRFGSSLTDDEKNWLCWEIREYLRHHSQRATVSPAVEALVRRP